MKQEQEKPAGYVLGFTKPDGSAQVQARVFDTLANAEKVREYISTLSGDLLEYKIFELWPTSTP